MNQTLKEEIYELLAQHEGEELDAEMLEYLAERITYIVMSFFRENVIQ